MTAEKATAQEATRKVAFAKVLAIQIIAYVLLVVFSPFRDGVAGHVIAAIAGLLSAICATTVMLGNVIFPAGLDGGKSFSMEEAWIAGVGGLLIVLIIVSFGRQMARENRTHLIRSLSHSVVEGVAMIASAGWCFLPVPSETRASVRPLFRMSPQTVVFASLPEEEPRMRLASWRSRPRGAAITCGPSGKDPRTQAR